MTALGGIVDVRTGNIPAPREPELAENWNGLARRLAEYGQVVLRSWIASGAVLLRVRAATGIALPWSPVLREPDMADELAGLTVAVALNSFHRSVIAVGGCESRRGTRTETVFIGHCLLSFPSEYHRWRREHHAGAPSPTLRLDEVDEPADEGLGDPERVVLGRLHIAEILRDSDDSRLRTAVLMRIVGYSHADIAVELRTTAKAVEMLFYRLRARLNKE